MLIVGLHPYMKMPQTTSMRNFYSHSRLLPMILIFLILYLPFSATSTFSQQITYEQPPEPIILRNGPEASLNRQKRQFDLDSDKIAFGFSSSSVKDSGPWNTWSALSECSRVCGGGVQYQKRVCLDLNNPRICVGPSIRYFSCNIHYCPVQSDFRADQCSRFDSIPFEGNYYKWIPHTKSGEPCHLNCRPENERFYVPLARKVIDGTPCYQNETTDICIEGRCVELGCDRKLGSKLREDKCRVCGGDGSTCRTVEGVEMQNVGFQSGYNDLFLIPAGATNILIREIKPTNNYLAVRSLSGKFFLNGDWHVRQSGTFEFANTKFYYHNRRKSGSNNIETLKSLGPTSEPLLIVLLHQEPNQGIAYEYSVPYSVYQPLPNASVQTTQTKGSKYAWIFGDFGACSRNCGTGVQKRIVFCGLINHDTGKQEKVKDELCDVTNRPVQSRSCTNETPCPATWFVGEWNNCSCVHQKQQRNVFCTSGEANEDKTFETDCPVLPEEKCHQAGPKPISIQNCKIENCPKWIAEEWSECDSNCGEGTHKRLVRCGFEKTKNEQKTMLIEDRIAPEEQKDDANILIQKRELEVTTVSSEIQKESGTNIEENNSKIEDDVFVDDSMCDPDTKPATTEVCFKKPCDEQGSVEWVVSSWSSCENDCGSKISTRSVQCIDSKGQIWSDNICLMMHGVPKPIDTKSCEDHYVCSKSFWLTSDWSECSDKSLSGIKTRHVLCGHFDETSNNFVIDDDENKCSDKQKPSTSELCKKSEDHFALFFGPYGPCSKPCGGGRSKRNVFCFKNSKGKYEKVPSENCKVEDTMLMEQCNTNACDADREAQLLGCENTTFGCCPTDYTTPADEDMRNCPSIKKTSTCDDSESNRCSCADTNFGCCPTRSQEALGPFGLGCSVNCENSKYGCCLDTQIVSNTTDQSDCPKPYVEIPTTTIVPTTTDTPALSQESFVPAKASKCEGNQCSQILLPKEVSSVFDCAKSQFGCCPDGWTSASGPDEEGCDEGSGVEGPGDNFFTTTISSIINMFTTVAPNVSETQTEPQVSETIVTSTESVMPEESIVKESDNCNHTEYGCCPNGITKAQGERFYGCTCLDYPFGCCQDRYTPASGENFEGCICSRMLFGCCPDGKTAVTGPNNEGCTCDSSTYGCCPDMVTAALGPNFQGCPCDTLTYGCCPGSKIPAKGPDFQGCSCADTPFGCCPNGITVAYGPNFQGCPSGPSLNLNLNSEVCGLQMEVGSCRNFTVKWFFDHTNGTCRRFWYGGCEGNGNRFQSQELCERACVKPEGIERCNLPSIRGPCNESQEAWYYNSKNRRCEPFEYGGCLGNTNRFESQRQCEENCAHQEKSVEVCDQPLLQGPCRGSHERWFYRKEDRKCYRFQYGGCKGNANNFKSKEDCQNTCAVQSPEEICTLPKAEGPCLGNFPRWHFDSNSGICREFIYTGCEGNKNRFVDRESCEQTCNQTLNSIYPQVSQGEISSSGKLHQIPKDYRKTDEWTNVCALPKAEGPCKASIIQWYFNSHTQRCERFYYGGCEGNLNRFDDRETCQSRCMHSNVHLSHPCLEPRETGNCTNFSNRYYFSVEDGTCHRFYYSGCNGNRNNFVTIDECNARCEQLKKTILRPVKEPESENSFRTEYCFKNFDFGSCNNANHIRFYYDHTDGICKEFIYGGCGGNENRFESQLQCQTNCWNSQDICKLKYARGSCSANFTQWFFDYNSNECFEFQYSGCQGNANRFNSKSACENQCQRRSEGYPPNYYPPLNSGSISESSSGSIAPIYNLPPQCYLPQNPGKCRGYFPMWFYSSQNHQCQQFIYGGCDGNENRFETATECEQTCRLREDSKDTEPLDNEDREYVCRLPAESGSCGRTQIKWYYEPSKHTCVPFTYGGCLGNKNRFQSFEDCIDLCKGIDIIPPIQKPSPSPPQPKPIEVQPIQPPQEPVPPQIPVPTDCEPLECTEDRCSLGIDYYKDARGCPACRCTNPCNDYPCPPDMSCALELYLNEQGKANGRTECRLKNKPGQCPAPEQIQTSSNFEVDSRCIQQCRTDADCRNGDKCCTNGCAFVCVSPRNDTLHISNIPTRPEAIPDEIQPDNDPNENFIAIDQSLNADFALTFSAGQNAILDCQADPSKGQIYWTRNREYITDSRDIRYEIVSNGSLHIKNLNLNDNAIYSCYQNQIQKSKNIRLQIEAPARIHHDSSTKVSGHLGESVYLFCNSLGYPVPRVTWLRNESALPIDGHKYMQFGNNTLLIQNLEKEDSGIYTCQAFNDIGSPAKWEVVLLLDSTSSTNEQTFYPYDPLINRISSSKKPENAIDQISVEIELDPKEYSLGSKLDMKCVVRSQITGEIINPTKLTSISWYFNSEIPLVNEPSQQKYLISDNNSTLTVFNLAKTDSGKYRCRANIGPFADASAFVSIQVEQIYVPPSCQDNPKFRNCDLIVKQKFCSNQFYAAYCCRSCYLSGQKNKLKR